MEKDLQKQALRWLRQFGGLWWKASDRFHAGIPDIVGCHRGVFVCIELKWGRGKLTPLQAKFLQDAEAAGGVAMAAWDLSSIKERMQRLKDNPRLLE